MISLFSIFVILICIGIIILIYRTIVYKKNDTPATVYERLITSQKETPVAFTFARIGDKYENYTYNGMDNILEKSLDDYPMNLDGSFHRPDQLYHGILNENENGFRITGVDIDFRCPSNFEYVNGQCKVRNICEPNDVNLYRGINYYYFTEKLLHRNEEISFHPRLYYYCNGNNTDGGGELRECKINELFVNVDALPATENPCRYYDVCEDRIEATKHKYQINDHILLENEYYLCNNRVSVLNRCPIGTGFSTVVNACMTINRCLDYSGTIPNNENSFIACRNGQEIVVNCSNGIFTDMNGQLSCKNMACLSKQIQFKTITYFRYPFGWLECLPFENVQTLMHCDDPMILVTSQLQHQNQPVYQVEKYLFDDYEIPTKFVTDDFQCADFNLEENSNFIINNIISTSYNFGLPEFNFNVLTEKKDYSEIPNVFYKDGMLIKESITDEIVQTNSTEFASFSVSDNYEIFLYQNHVQRNFGDLDFIIYAIMYDMSVEIPNRSIENLFDYIDADGLTISPPEESNLYFNAYNLEFTEFDLAHSSNGIDLLPFENSFIYQYRVLDLDENNNVVTMVSWTHFGLVKIKGLLSSFAKVDENFQLSHLTLPLTKDIIEPLIPINRFNGILSNIKHQMYSYLHEPICLQYLENVEILEPPLAITLGIENLFQVYHENYYENFTDVVQF